MEGKRDQGGISALGVFVESMIWNKLRREESLYIVYPNFVWTFFKHMPNIYRGIIDSNEGKNVREQNKYSED